MSRSLKFLPLVFVCAPFACSSSSTSTPEPASGPTIEVTSDAFDVPPGKELFMCTVTNIVLDKAFDVVKVTRNQQLGSHHAVLFYSTDEVPVGPTHECTNLEMTAWRLVGGAEGQELGLKLPANTALEVPKGARLILQSHYINPGGTPLHVKDTVKAIGPADAKSITQHADPFTVIDSDFEVPGFGEQTRIAECPIEQDINVLNLFGHEHQWGTRFKAFVVRGDTGKVEPLYNEPGGVQLQFSPPLIDYVTTNGGGLLLKKGDTFRIECSWKNDGTKPLTFPGEMCVAQMYYAPARGFLVCGKATKTLGDTMPPGGVETGMTGCDTPPSPTDACVRPCDKGNSRGVGKFCTKGGHECDDNQSATICTVNADDTAPPFCTKPCADDTTCGVDAKCTGDTRGKGCVPILCVGK